MMAKSDDILLDVLIATHGNDGLEKVAAMELPLLSEVRYIVSCQTPERLPIPQTLKRDDVVIHFTPTTGTSTNRNHLLDLATAPFCLIGDNDLQYSAHGLKAVIRSLKENPDLDIITFRYDGPDKRKYPKARFDIMKPGYNTMIVAFEIAFRNERIKNVGLRFNPLMSPGASFLECGEDNLFILAASVKGLNGAFFPITICRHQGLTSGYRPRPSKGILRAQGALITLSFPTSYRLRLIIKAWRVGGNMATNLIYMSQGSRYARENKEKLLN